MKSYLKFLLIVLLSSCSVSGSGTDNPEVREVLVGLSNNYLMNVINGNFGELSSVILWDEYLGNKEKSFSRKKYFEQLSTLDGRYKIANHPLLKLEFTDANISGDNAELSFKNKDSEEIELSFIWVESGWILSNDNLFGDDGLFNNLEPLTEQQKKEPGKIKQKRLNALDLE